MPEDVKMSVIVRPELHRREHGTALLPPAYVNMRILPDQMFILRCYVSSPASGATLLMFERYTCAAIIEWERLQEGLSVLDRVCYGQGMRANVTVFSDIHFLLICLDKLQNLLKALATAEGNPRIAEFFDQVRPRFKCFNDFRNHLEHVDERIQRGGEALNDLGNLHGSVFSFGGEQIDLGDQVLEFIYTLYHGLTAILRRSGGERQA